ncbi:unnamed protein product [Notodromas monacha]|uniref:Sulfatase N-terminal domain-containing protein n=1 Tax=Notodromas monacha TaxID=399045 RepID=A0A7R9GEQ9_9CRUS|nr:unnamed protein product [Notodromas monacha]CAG0919900.1 unnamed protein product [Notodromas monacha]
MEAFPLAVATLLAWCCVFAAGDADKPPPPNLVVFLVDDLGYGDVGCFGNQSLPTPNIDRLCREGVKLSQHIAASPICTPSRAALLTARYPVSIGMESSRLNRVFLNLASTGGLPVGVKTLPRVLQESGYSTALIGKWHLGLHCGFPPDFCHHPNSHGFDYFYGLPLTNLRDFGNNDGLHSSVLKPFMHLVTAAWVSLMISALTFLWLVTKRACAAAMVFLLMCSVLGCVLMPLHNFRTFSGVLMKNLDVVEQPLDLDGLTERFVGEAMNFIDQQASDDKPFLLFLAFTHVHTALVPGNKFRGKSQFGAYGDSVMEVDHSMGQILAQLDALDLTDNTVVYFSSDNGAHQEETMGDGSPAGGSNFPLKGGKGMGSMEGGIRVPSVIRYPKVFPAGREVAVPTSQMDLLPTFASLAGLNVDTRRMDGKDLTQVLSNGTDDSPHKVLLHFCGTYLHGARYVEDVDHVWKVIFAHPKFLPGTYRCEFICFCTPGDVVTLDPPLVYNIQEDMTEKHALNPATDKYRQVLDLVKSAARDLDEALMVNPPEDQFSILNSIWRPWLQPCCDFGKMCSCDS